MKVMEAIMYLFLFYVQLTFMFAILFLYFLKIFNLGNLIRYLISGKVIPLTINVVFLL